MVRRGNAIKLPPELKLKQNWQFHMQLTINLPDVLPTEKTSKLIQKIEQIFITEGISAEIELPTDSWDKLDVEKIAVDTGIQDFAENHDHYLYGNPKKS